MTPAFFDDIEKESLTTEKPVKKPFYLKPI